MRAWLIISARTRTANNCCGQPRHASGHHGEKCRAPTTTPPLVVVRWWWRRLLTLVVLVVATLLLLPYRSLRAHRMRHLFSVSSPTYGLFPDNP